MKPSAPLFLLFAGLAIGGGTVNLADRFMQSRSSSHFEQRIRCKDLADKYVKDNSNEGDIVSLVDVDFSRSKTTCMAALITFSPGDYETWSLVDLLTNDGTTIGSCNEHEDCGNGKNVNLENKLQAAFDKSIK